MVDQGAVTPPVWEQYLDDHDRDVISRGRFARRMGFGQSAAVIVIERLAFGFDNTPIDWRRSRGPAARFAYETGIRCV